AAPRARDALAREPGSRARGVAAPARPGSARVATRTDPGPADDDAAGPWQRRAAGMLPNCQRAPGSRGEHDPNQRVRHPAAGWNPCQERRVGSAAERGCVARDWTWKVADRGHNERLQ